MFPPTLHPGNHSRGFTLVESLVALTIMMILLSAIGGLTASSLRTSRYVERHLAEMENAQQILAGLPGRDQLANRTQSGEMAGYRWRLDAEPFSAPFLASGAQARWTPETIVLTIQGPGGAPLSFDMIRLVRTASK